MVSSWGGHAAMLMVSFLNVMERVGTKPVPGLLPAVGGGDAGGFLRRGSSLGTGMNSPPWHRTSSFSSGVRNQAVAEEVSISPTAAHGPQETGRDAVLARQPVVEDADAGEADDVVLRVRPLAGRGVPHRHDDVPRLQDVQRVAHPGGIRHARTALHLVAGR